MEESVKSELERALMDVIEQNKFKFVMRRGDTRYFRHKDGRAAILRRDERGEVKLERLDR